MAAGDELVDFVRDALGRGVPRAQIEEALRKGGWTADQIRVALAAFVDLDFPVPVPRARPYLSAREAFMYLVLFGTLYASAYYLGSLIFDFINLTFPDPAQRVESYEHVHPAVDALVDLVADRGLSGVLVFVVDDRARGDARSDEACLKGAPLAHVSDAVLVGMRAASATSRRWSTTRSAAS